jgi:proteasome lid subunit RPN8/RPN11
MTVSLSRVWADLCEQARATRDGAETAGFLFGQHVRSWHSRVPVDWITTMVNGRSESSCDLDLLALVAEKAAIRSCGADDRVGEIGSWHSHPTTSDGEPSDADLTTWLNAHDFLGHPYASLIVTSGERGDWSFPDVHGWIVRRTDSGHPVCEPATVEVR